MTDTLRELSDKELSLGQTGVFNYAHAAVDGGGNAADLEFRDIHNAYLHLHQHTGDEAIRTESLKRMVFLNWYYLAQPAMLTGMTDLDHDTVVAAYRLLNDLIKTGKLDPEFAWMMAFYSTRDLTILEFTEDGLSELAAFIAQHRWAARQPPLKEQLGNVMENRGQMGRFWNMQQGVAL